MSQAGIISVSGGGGGGSPIETITTQSGTAVPVANNIILNAYDTTENSDNGIETKAGVAGGDPPGTGVVNEVDVYLTNRATGQLTTVDATKTTIISFPLGIVAGTFYMEGNVEAFAATGPSSGAYTYSVGYRTNGVTATIIGSQFHDTFEDAAFTTTDIFTDVSGNNAIVQVQGLAGTSINWNAELNYRQVN
jgi:hypothetical protein